MREREPIVCSECEVEMNRHARKLIEPRSADERARMDPELGAVVLEAHCCPACGESRSRVVS